MHRGRPLTHIGILALGSVGLMAGGLGVAVGVGYAFVNALAVLVFLFLIASLWTLVQQLHRTRSVALALIVAGALFWYAYANAVAAIWLPSRCLAWTPCFSADEILVTHLYFFAFLAGIGLMYRFTGCVEPRSPRGLVNQRTRFVPPFLDLVGMSAILVGLLPTMASGLSFEDLLLATALGRTEEKEWVPTSNIGSGDATLYWAARLFLVTGLTITFARLLTASISTRRRLLLLALWSIPFVFQAFDTGTRFVTLAILLPGLLLRFLLAERRVRLHVVVIVIFGFVALSQLQLFSRAEHGTTFEEYDAFRSATLLGSTDFFHETANAVRLYDDIRRPIFDNDLLIFATFLLPRGIWPDKPVPEVVRTYTLYRWGTDILMDAGNVFPGLIGQYVLSLGILGPAVVGMVFGSFASGLDKRIRGGTMSMEKLPFLCYCVGFFLSFRYFSPGYFVTPLLVHLTILLSRRYRGLSR